MTVHKRIPGAQTRSNGARPEHFSLLEKSKGKRFKCEVSKVTTVSTNYVCVWGGYNDGISSWEEVETSHIRNAINLQPEIHKEIVKNEGGATVYLYSNAQRKE